MHRLWPTKNASVIVSLEVVGSRPEIQCRVSNTERCPRHEKVCALLADNTPTASDVPLTPVCFSACDFGPCEPEIVLRSSPSRRRSPWLLRTKSRARVAAAYRTVGLGP